MEKYDLTIVIPGKITAAKKKTAQELIEKLVKTFKGRVLNLDEWGELKLEYKIKGNESGIFLQYSLELEKQAIKQLDDKLRIEEEIIRYLLVRKETRLRERQ